jgi:hypothetical protein
MLLNSAAEIQHGKLSPYDKLTDRKREHEHPKPDKIKSLHAGNDKG